MSEMVDKERLQEALLELSDLLGQGPNEDSADLIRALISVVRQAQRDREKVMKTATDQGRRDADRIRKIVEAWDENWDCSGTPGHQGMFEAVEEARQFLEAGR